MAGWNPGGMLSDIFQTGKDVFLAREANQATIDRQAAAIRTEKTLQESASQASAIKSKSMTQNLIYVGIGLVAVALFVGVMKSI